MYQSDQTKRRHGHVKIVRLVLKTVFRNQRRQFKNRFLEVAQSKAHLSSSPDMDEVIATIVS
jgi:hypothetical protein